MMPDLLPVTLPEMIAEVRRELRLRRKVYPNHVAAGRITQDQADRRIEVMEAALRELETLAGEAKP